MLPINSSRLQISILIYLVLIFLLIYLRPSYLYKKNGKFKEFGTGKNKTILPFWLIILIFAFFSYYIAQIILYVNFLRTT